MGSDARAAAHRVSRNGDFRKAARFGGDLPQGAGAEVLSAADDPHASVAAIQRPSLVSCGRPTA